MGYYCTVPQCTSLAGKTKNVKFHRFPRDTTMADRWNVILKRGKPYTKYSKVCSLHFTQSDYNITTMGQWKTLSKDAVPSQNLPKLNPDGTVMVIRKSRTVKYREGKKDESEKFDKWAQSMATPHPGLTSGLSQEAPREPHDVSLPYRLQSLNAIANNVSPQNVPNLTDQRPKAKKQDAYMQTDPVSSEEDDTQPNNSYSETSEPFSNTENFQYQKNQEKPQYQKNQENPKDYTKPNEDYIPQTNEEYNKEAEKYAFSRKNHSDSYQKIPENGYQKIPETYPLMNKDGYQNRDYVSYQNGFSDSAEILRNQQHNLQILQEQHRINENQNFFNENHIKQEIDLSNEEEKFLYDGHRNKDQIDASGVYSDDQRRVLHQQRLLEHLQQQVKQEPDAANAREVSLQSQESPYYGGGGGHSNVAGYYEPRPGPELLIAKQNALAAHTQLWQNTMKRPFFYTDSSHYNGPQLLHRFEDITRILQ